MKRTHQWIVAASFLAIIYSVPVVQSVIELSSGRAPQFFDVFQRFPTRTTLRSYEKELEDSAVVARASRPWVQYGWFVLFGDAGEKVLVGRDGWLFYRPDVRYLVEAPVAPSTEKVEDPVQTIVDFRDQLHARGIHLLVVPMPGKPSLYGGKLTRRSGASRVVSPTLDLIARLRAARVETIDLFELFGKPGADAHEPYYLARDTHWSPKAAELAAIAVAARINEMGWLDPGAVEYGVRTIAVRRRSDIARMTGSPWIEAAFPAEQVDGRQVYDKTGANYKDDPASPVLVLGDSFLRIYQTDDPAAAGFISHLARALRFPLTSVVNDGGASTLVRQELARRPQLLVGKKLVIWEFVERDIRFGMEGWKQVTLPSGNWPPLNADQR